MLVAVDLRFTFCPTAAAITKAVVAANLPYVTVAVNMPVDNVKRYEPAGRTDVAAGHRIDANPAEWPGGLFRVHLLGELGRAVNGRSA